MAYNTLINLDLYNQILQKYESKLKYSSTIYDINELLSKLYNDVSENSQLEKYYIWDKELMSCCEIRYQERDEKGLGLDKIRVDFL